MTQINQDDVKKIAKLVKLDVEGQENLLAEMFSATLDYIEILNELETDKVPETYQVTGLQNVYQKDSTQSNTLSQADALKNASAKDNNLFETKGVFDR
jgi:aspartyl-tRNA(Asn)/glutamyl-tRNA(Gln) amidotransferase subunit C